MFFSAPPRNFQAELLDLDEAPFDEVKESLNDVRRVNRYLSGYRVLLHHVKSFWAGRDSDRPFTILDVATGSADQPVEIIKLARRMGIPVRITAIDINRKMLRFAQEETQGYPEIHFAQCDIHSLPFGENSFDLVVNSLSLHHFRRANAVTILRSIFDIGRLGFIVNDLHRSRVAYASIYLLTRLLTKNRLTRYDAPVSVMNAFTPGEMRGMCEEAEIPHFDVIRHFPYRLALVARKAKLSFTGV